MSSPVIIAAMRLRGSSMASSSTIVSWRARWRSSEIVSATCAMVLCWTRAPTGCRSAWYVSSRPSGEVPFTTWASFQPRFTASCTPTLRPWPPCGEWTWAASPASSTRPARYEAACRVMSVNREIQLGLCTPKSVPYAATSNSRRSSSVGSPAWSTRPSFNTTRYGPPSCWRSTGPMPPPSGRTPICGALAISTSAMTKLVDGSSPGSRCRRTCGSRCGRRRTRRGSPLAATCHRPVRRQRRCRPVRGRPPPRPEALGLGARRSTPPGCARSGAARAPARSCGGGNR